MGRFLKGLGLIIALIGVGIVSAFAVVALLLRQEEVRMPDLTGQDIVNVIETVAQQGLQLKVDRREAHPTLPRDAVISQSPLPGVGIKKGRQVHVVVSQGPSDTQALKLVGENFRKADIMIRQAGFSPGTISRVSSNRVERDIVIAQEPEAGSPLVAHRRGSRAVRFELGRELAALIPGAQLAALDGRMQPIYAECAEAAASTLLSFLRDQSGTRGPKVGGGPLTARELQVAQGERHAHDVFVLLAHADDAARA